MPSRRTLAAAAGYAALAATDAVLAGKTSKSAPGAVRHQAAADAGPVHSVHGRHQWPQGRADAEHRSRAGVLLGWRRRPRPERQGLPRRRRVVRGRARGVHHRLRIPPRVPRDARPQGHQGSRRHVGDDRARDGARGPPAGSELGLPIAGYSAMLAAMFATSTASTRPSARGPAPRSRRARRCSCSPTRCWGSRSSCSSGTARRSSRP